MVHDSLICSFSEELLDHLCRLLLLFGVDLDQLVQFLFVVVRLGLHLHLELIQEVSLDCLLLCVVLHHDVL